MLSSAEHKVDIDRELKRAVRHHRCGNLKEAEKIYAQILAMKPQHADALHLLGVVWLEKGKVQRARDLIKRAIESDDKVPLYYVSLGDVYQAEGKHDDAVSIYRRALRLNPESIEALCNMGNALREQDNLQQAIACYRKCLALKPDLPKVFNNMGVAYFKQQNHQSAVECLNKAIDLNPNDAEPYNNLGNVYRDQSDFETAVKYYRQALSIAPDNPLINYNLGVVYQILRDHHQSFVFYRTAIEQEPTFAAVHSNLAKLYQDLNFIDSALEHYNKAIEIDPNHADARFNRSLALLTTCNFDLGWPEYEWRFKRSKWKKIYPHRLKKKRWDGCEFPGKTLFIHSEQGFGDTIQFIRYLPQVKKLGGTVVFEVRKELFELLREIPEIDRLSIMSFETPPQNGFDYFIPLLSLPGLFKTTLESIPNSVPYLRAPRDKQARWSEKINGSEPKVGLVWAAKPTYDHQKSCPFENLFPLLDMGQLKFFGLQKGQAVHQLTDSVPNIINLGIEFETFADTAGAIECLNLVISVDTAVAHLAGAMGKPVWLILPYAPDWRWLLNREDSPWYPTMRIYRQPKPGDWKTVVDQVATELNRWIEAADRFERQHVKLSGPESPMTARKR